MSMLGKIYMTRASAVADGATHTAIHFGVAHWVCMDAAEQEVIWACPKVALLEPWITLCLHAHAFVNSLREPGDQVDFAFAVRRLDSEVQA